MRWLNLDRPQDLLKALPPARRSQRKLRLFGCACVRRVCQVMTDKRGLQAVETTERFADGLANKQALATASGKANWAIQYAAGVAPQSALRAASLIAAEPFTAETELRLVEDAAGCARCAEEDAELACRAQVALLRCIFANPFSPMAFDPTWRTPTVTSLAIAAYEERKLPSGELDAVRLALLADALEEAGCSAETILDHLREPGPHTRGCWPVDLLLSRA